MQTGPLVFKLNITKPEKEIESQLSFGRHKSLMLGHKSKYHPDYSTLVSM